MAHFPVEFLTLYLINEARGDTAFYLSLKVLAPSFKIINYVSNGLYRFYF